MSSAKRQLLCLCLNVLTAVCLHIYHDIMALPCFQYYWLLFQNRFWARFIADNQINWKTIFHIVPYLRRYLMWDYWYKWQRSSNWRLSCIGIHKPTTQPSEVLSCLYTIWGVHSYHFHDTTAVQWLKFHLLESKKIFYQQQTRRTVFQTDKSDKVEPWPRVSPYWSYELQLSMSPCHYQSTKPFVCCSDELDFLQCPLGQDWRISVRSRIHLGN